ncbi:hypothetical protein LCGC14_1031470 [marine sediment metagenome]|uniref:NqrA second alpha/beta domain-containing protein n=1 Tax=marine sediment metagenome TaxID=412755 RepID=A0A0F9QCK0_9ZZZZ
MKLAGGYNVSIKGRPSNDVEVLPEPQVLQLPLQSRFLNFSNVRVEEGQHVRLGEVLAKDPDHFAIPLLAPRAGTVRLAAAENHIVLEDVSRADHEPYDSFEETEHIPENLGSVGIKRYKLLQLGAWQFFRNAETGGPVDPFGTPTAVIVSTVHFEPYVARGDVQMQKRLRAFTRGLEHLQTLLEYQQIYLALPEVHSSLALKVRDMIRGYAWAKPVGIPFRYPRRTQRRSYRVKLKGRQLRIHRTPP